MTREEEIRARRDSVAGEPFAVKTHSEDYGQGYGETTYFVGMGGTLLKIGIADSQEKGTRYYTLASFIAHAHADIPYLLDENARLRAELNAIKDGTGTGQLVSLPNELIAPYELNERYWVCGWDADDCTLTIQDRALKSKAEARAALEGEEHG